MDYMFHSNENFCFRGNNKLVKRLTHLSKHVHQQVCIHALHHWIYEGFCLLGHQSGQGRAAPQSAGRSLKSLPMGVTFRYGEELLNGLMANVESAFGKDLKVVS